MAVIQIDLALVNHDSKTSNAVFSKFIKLPDSQQIILMDEFESKPY